MSEKTTTLKVGQQVKLFDGQIVTITELLKDGGFKASNVIYSQEKLDKKAVENKVEDTTK